MSCNSAQCAEQLVLVNMPTHTHAAGELMAHSNEPSQQYCWSEFTILYAMLEDTSLEDYMHAYLASDLPPLNAGKNSSALPFCGCTPSSKWSNLVAPPSCTSFRYTNSVARRW